MFLTYLWFFLRKGYAQCLPTTYQRPVLHRFIAQILPSVRLQLDTAPILWLFYCQGHSHESCTELDTVPILSPDCLLLPGTVSRELHRIGYCSYPISSLSFIARDSLTSATQHWMLHISYPILSLLLPGTVSRELHSIEYCTYILTYPFTVFLARASLARTTKIIYCTYPISVFYCQGKSGSKSLLKFLLRGVIKGARRFFSAKPIRK
jgi:hypothetical protein